MAKQDFKQPMPKAVSSREEALNFIFIVDEVGSFIVLIQVLVQQSVRFILDEVLKNSFTIYYEFYNYLHHLHLLNPASTIKTIRASLSNIRFISLYLQSHYQRISALIYFLFLYAPMTQTLNH